MNDFPEVYIIEFRNEDDGRYNDNCKEFCTRLWCKAVCTFVILFFCYCGYLFYDIHI